jgi:hypothetical protein
VRQRFDEQLFDRMLQKPWRQMQIESMASERGALRRADGGLTPQGFIQIVDGHLAVLRKWLEEVDRICRQVWETQGEAITPDFVRGTLKQKTFEVIASREGAIGSTVHLAAVRGRYLADTYPAQSHLAMEVARLRPEVNNQYEIEARMLEHRNAKIVAPVDAKRRLKVSPEWQKHQDLLMAASSSDSSAKSVENKPARRKPERDNPEVAKRAALVRTNPNIPAKDMCEIFDREGVPLSAKWLDARLKTWSEAYKNPRYRSRIHTLISKDRQRN